MFGDNRTNYVLSFDLAEVTTRLYLKAMPAEAIYDHFSKQEIKHTALTSVRV